jgi:hypothetical protein
MAITGMLFVALAEGRFLMVGLGGFGLCWRCHDMIGSMMEFVCDMLEDVSVLGRRVDIEGSMMMMMTMVVASVLCG